MRLLFHTMASLLSVCGLLIQIACYNETIKAKINWVFLSALNFACKVPLCKFAHGDATSEAICTLWTVWITSLTQQELNIGSGRGFENDDDHHDHVVVYVILHSEMAGRGRQQMQVLLNFFLLSSHCVCRSMSVFIVGGNTTSRTLYIQLSLSKSFGRFLPSSGIFYNIYGKE
jgi:hypothetical protein